MKKIVFIVSFVLCVCLFALPAFAIEYVEFVDSVTGYTYATCYVNDSYQVVDEYVPYHQEHTGYNFLGWSESSESFVDSYFYDGQVLYLEFSYEEGDYTYYAYYELISSGDVSHVDFYDGVTGNLISTIEANDGGQVDIFPSAPNKPGLTFAGWYDNIDGEGEPYTDYQFDDYYGGSVEMFALYTVQWQKINQFGNSSGSVFYGTPKRDVFGTPYEPDGYTFLHWSTSSNGVAYSVNGLLTEPLTLYAVYRYDGGTVTDPVDPPVTQPPFDPWDPIDPNHSNLDRDTVLMLGDALFDGFYTAFKDLTTNSYILGFRVLNILMGIVVIGVALVVVKLWRHS